MRRFVSTASAVAVTILAACGGGEADPATQTPEAAAPAPEAQQPEQATMDLPDGVTAEMVAEGDAIFHGVGICQTCHGPDGTGVGNLAPNLTDGTWLNVSGRNYEEIVGIITSGVAQPQEAAAPMPAKGGANLTDEQVRAVAAYVYTLSQ